MSARAMSQGRKREWKDCILLPLPTFLMPSPLDKNGSTKRRGDLIKENCVAPGLTTP